MEYIKKPIPIEAEQYLDESILEFIDGEAFIDIHDRLCIETLEGIMVCEKEDYVIKGVEGEYYPVKEEIFNKTYEPAKKLVTREQALELLLDWAKQCDFGFDNFRDDDVVDWIEFETQSADLDYTESMIHYAMLYLKNKQG